MRQLSEKFLHKIGREIWDIYPSWVSFSFMISSSSVHKNTSTFIWREQTLRSSILINFFFLNKRLLQTKKIWKEQRSNATFIRPPKPSDILIGLRTTCDQLLLPSCWPSTREQAGDRYVSAGRLSWNHWLYPKDFGEIYWS